MKKVFRQILHFNKKAVFVLISILLSVVSVWGQAILSGDRSVPVEAKNGMVVTSHTLATEVALEVLKKGGNAIDAAVTAGFALAVTQPRSGNIGGGLYADFIARKE
jgi:gamma-glutamyltranspeptidase/glutathione hydrolase